MTHLRIEQNNIPEIVSSKTIQKLYDFAISGTLDPNSNFSGNLQVSHCKSKVKDYLEQNYQLSITCTDGYYIDFKDPLTEQICVQNWGDGIGVTYAQAQSVRKIGTQFVGSDITSFDELKYFTNVTMLPVAEGTPYNGTGVFSGCTKLKSIDLTNVTAIGRACFRNCTSLESVKNTQNLTSINIDGYSDEAFLNCTSLEYIDLSNVTTIYSSAFRDCSKLANVESLQNLQVIGNLSFYNCTSLNIDVLLPNFTNTDFRYGFAYSGITSAIVPEGVQRMNGEYHGQIGTTICGFKNCTNLNYAILPSTLTLIQGPAFIGCSSLKWVKCNSTTPPQFKTADTGDWEYPFNISGSFKIYVPDKNVQTYKSNQYWAGVADKIYPMSQFATDFPND